MNTPRLCDLRTVSPALRSSPRGIHRFGPVERSRSVCNHSGYNLALRRQQHRHGRLQPGLGGCHGHHPERAHVSRLRFPGQPLHLRHAEQLRAQGGHQRRTSPRWPDCAINGNATDTCNTASQPGPDPAQGLLAPTGLAIDSSNTLYIADSQHNCVRSLASGAVDSFAKPALTTVAGTCTSVQTGSDTPVPDRPGGGQRLQPLHLHRGFALASPSTRWCATCPPTRRRPSAPLPASSRPMQPTPSARESPAQTPNSTAPPALPSTRTATSSSPIQTTTACARSLEWRLCRRRLGSASTTAPAVRPRP